jgi:hypothetical protein
MMLARSVITHNRLPVSPARILELIKTQAGPTDKNQSAGHGCPRPRRRRYGCRCSRAVSGAEDNIGSHTRIILLIFMAGRTMSFSLGCGMIRPRAKAELMARQ